MTNDKSKISIALCTYNGEKFLPAQLESFLAQTRQPDELVVCDDCSADASAEIVEAFARRAAFPVRLHRNERNLRSTKNFEKAISLCTGDLIFLSDQDDVWLPEKLARTELEFDKDRETAMVFSNAEIVDENLHSTGDDLWSFTFDEEKRDLARGGKFFDVLLSQNVVTGATMAFRAGCRQDFTPIPDDIPNLIHDGWISLIAANIGKVALIDEPLVKYRQHQAQQLGIDYRAGRAEGYDERLNRYAASILFIENEIRRLEQMRGIFEIYPQFEARRGKIGFENLIGEKREKIKHYEARSRLPASRLKRLPPVLKEAASGRYRKFSKGFLSAAKDLFEKW